MNDLLKRLKFDIYERVNLDDKNEDIKVIEETELTPQLKMLLSKNEVKLVGNLLLKIKYIGDIPFQTNEFEHNIPVEITIPSGRVVDAWKLDADIENFNIDLLGNRAVCVTGVMVVYEKESVKVEKVKLPREIVTALDDFKETYAEFEYMVMSALVDKKDTNACTVTGGNLRKYGRDSKDNFKLILLALVNGYEVEQTPEDKAREYYNGYKDKCINAGDSDEFSLLSAKINAIETVLNLLNIKIEGINT